MPCKAICFDLDGTLIDPREGIFDALRYALRRLNVRQPPAEEFPSFVGPPLRRIFSRILETKDPQVVEQAVVLYRQRYSTAGIYRCDVYPGIARMLDNLDERGFGLYVATIKPTPYAQKILVHTGLASLFRAVHGSDLDGSLDEKDRLVKGLLDAQGLNPAESVMVGDRYMDIDAAKANGLASIGVSYGFGSRRELVEAGADRIADSPQEITTIVDKLGRKAPHVRSPEGRF